MLIEIRRYCALMMSRKRVMQSCCSVCSVFSHKQLEVKRWAQSKVFFSESTYCVGLAARTGHHIVSLDLRTWDEMPMRSASNGVLPAATPFVDVEAESLNTGPSGRSIVETTSQRCALDAVTLSPGTLSSATDADRCRTKG